MVSVSFLVSIEYAPVHIPTCSADRGAQFPDYGGSDDEVRGSAHEEIGYLPGDAGASNRVEVEDEVSEKRGRRDGSSHQMGFDDGIDGGVRPAGTAESCAAA